MKLKTNILSFKNIISILFISSSLILFQSCSKKIYPNRSQFIGDGDYVPRMNLCEYKSVQERRNQNPNLGVAMAISGGGSRSANFAMGVMLGLEKIKLSNGNNALQEIDYLSTVSGGGFAGGAYINSLYEHHYTQNPQAYSLNNSVENNIRSTLKRSYINALLKANINPILWFSLVDDGDALEKDIDDYVLGRKNRLSKNLENRSITLGDLFIDEKSEKEVLFPMMFANGTVYDKMLIFPFSPDILEAYHVVAYTHRLKKKQHRISF